jgi:hypothetical protein
LGVFGGWQVTEVNKYLFFYGDLGKGMRKMKVSLHELNNPPLTVIDAWRRSSGQQRMRVAAWVSASFFVLSFGLTFFLLPEEPSSYFKLVSKVGVVKTAVPLKQDRAFVVYELLVENYSDGKSIRIALYARRNSCRFSNLRVGQRVVLSINELNPGYEVRRAASVGGCQLYDDNLNREIRSAKNASVYGYICYFFVLGVLSFVTFIFYWRRNRLQH